MSLSADDVRRIAHLARIEVHDDRIEPVRHDLNGILDLIARMQAVDTTDVAPMAHAQAVHQRLREDRATEPDRRADYQANAPETESGLYLVPKVIE